MGKTGEPPFVFILQTQYSIYDMALPPREQTHYFLKYEGLEYSDVDIADFEARLARIYRREDSILRICHRLIACSIAGRSQAPEKVTVTDLFYLRGMDVDLVNVPYLLARYLRLFAAGRKSGAHISRGQFVARLAEHFGLLTAEILGGLTVIAPELPIIDMAKLVRLQIYAQFNDTWAWVAMGPERQPDAAAGAPIVAEDAPIVDEGNQAIPVPIQAPQQPPPPPPAAARTMPQRLGRLEEDVQGLRRDLMDSSGLTCQAFDETFRGSSPAAFQRQTRQRNG
ncbi:hypothetical protein Tco_1061762 [Tanacetum coccineum]